MALASASQDDFSAGIFRGRKAPPGAVYDAVNGLIDDTGLLYKRGGSAYWSTSNASTLTRLATAYMVGPKAQRVVAWGASDLFVFDASPAPVAFTMSPSGAYGRPVSVGGLLIWERNESAGNELLLYGGSLTPPAAATFNTVTVTIDSATVTKTAGTSWVGTATPGMILRLTVGSATIYGIVRTVDSANQVTLVDPWTGPTTSTTSYELVGLKGWPILLDAPIAANIYLGSAGSPARLLLALGNRVYESARGNPLDVDSDVYHELPPAMEITGIQGVGDSALVFGSTGVWALGNLNLDPIDAFGNIQQTVEQVTGDVILWGEAGITPWAGGAIVPAIDDIYLLGLDGATVPITGDSENEKVRRLYRSYTKTAGYLPGTSCVHRGHLFMSVMNGSTVVDTLVCRLDRGSPWTRWSGHAAGAGFAVLPSTSSVAPKLLSVASQRVTDLSGTLDPVAGNSADADATVPSLTVITRDYPLSAGGAHGFCKRLRVRAEVTDDANGATAAAAATVEYSSDADGGTFTALTEKGEQNGGSGWATSTGALYWWALVGKRRERIRFRLVFSGGTASTILRSIELLLRPTGKQ